MRGRTIITNEGAFQFSRILDELRSSIADLMHIADNMIPEDVLTKGLKSYITEMCKNLESNNLKFNLDISSKLDTLDEEEAISVYKIFKSLVQYLLNFTEAREISLLFSIQDNTIILQETDDGKNFNLSALSYPGIDDLAEIKSIVEKLHGNFNILRKNNKNETNITIPL